MVLLTNHYYYWYWCAQIYEKVLNHTYSSQGRKKLAAVLSTLFRQIIIILCNLWRIFSNSARLGLFNFFSLWICVCKIEKEMKSKNHQHSTPKTQKRILRNMYTVWKGNHCPADQLTKELNERGKNEKRSTIDWISFRIFSSLYFSPFIFFVFFCLPSFRLSHGLLNSKNIGYPFSLRFFFFIEMVLGTPYNRYQIRNPTHSNIIIYA